MKKITLYTLLGLTIVCAVTGIALLLISLIGSKAIKNGLYITNSYDITEAFENIEIDTRECTVYFSKSYDGKIKAVLHENEKALHKVYVDDNTLKIEKADANIEYKSEDKRYVYDGDLHTGELNIISAEFGKLQSVSGTNDASIRSLTPFIVPESI